MELDPISPAWRLIAILCSLAGFFIWESLTPYRAQAKRGLHAARNLTIAGINAVLVGLCCAGATVAVAQWSEANRWGLLHFTGLPPGWQIVVAFVALDLWTYWWHRANHRAPLLWRFHRMHHSDPNMDVSTAMRFHAGELLLSAALRLSLIPIFGLPLASVAIYSAAVVIVTEFHHANISLGDGLDSAVRLFIVSPNMHKVHHSRECHETDSNYSTVFSGWDRLFRTYRQRESYRSIRFGLDRFDSEKFQTLRGLVLTPLSSESRSPTKP